MQSDLKGRAGLRKPEEAPRVAVVIPTLNAAETIGATLDSVTAGKAGLGLEIVVSDGGSTDRTVALCQSRADVRLIAGPPGRGVQLARGAAAATAPWIVFLHADTRLEAGWGECVRAFAGDPANAARAGYFAFALDDGSPAARRLERMVAWRSRALGLPYGDQGLLVPRTLLHAVGGFRPLPLMEDVDLVRRIGRKRLAALEVQAVTSARRFREGGYLRRSSRNLVCLGLYFLGLPPRLIRRIYG